MLIKKIALIIIGVGAIIIGLIGFLLPFLPGWLFIFFGLALIAPTKSEKIITEIKKLLKKWIEKK